MGSDWSRTCRVGSRLASPLLARGRRGSAAAIRLPTIDGEPIELTARDNGIELALPTRDGRPVPSPARAPSGAGERSGASDGTLSWSSVPVRTAALEPGPALDLLLSFEDRHGGEAGASVDWFARAALFAVELVARGRFLPSIVDSGASTRVRWRAAPAAGDIGRIATFAASIPTSCLAARPDLLDSDDGPAACTEEFISASVDAIVRAAGAAIRLPGAAPEALRTIVSGGPSLADVEPPAALRAAFDRWADALRPPVGAFRTLLRLREPVAEDDLPVESPWRLEVLVGARADPSLVVPAHRSG